MRDDDCLTFQPNPNVCLIACRRLHTENYCEQLKRVHIGLSSLVADLRFFSLSNRPNAHPANGLKNSENAHK